MEGQGNHGHDGIQIDFHHTVIEGLAAGFHFPVSLGPSVDLKILSGVLIRYPYGGEAGGFGGHGVDAVPEIHGKALYAGSYKLQHLVLNEIVLKYRSDEAQSHVHGAYPGLGSAGQVNGNHLRIINLIVFSQHSLGQLRSALADGYGTLGAVAGMGVGNDSHITGVNHHFTHVLVNHRLVRGNENSAGFHAGALRILMHIRVDGPAYGAEAVVAVGKYAGHGEFL